MDFSYWNLSFDSFAFQSENDLGSEKEMETSPAKIPLYLIVEVCRADSLNQISVHMTIKKKFLKETGY